MTAPAFKRCGCGRAFTGAEWLALEYVGRMDDCAGGYLALRNCVCGSTISVDADDEAHEAAGQRLDAAAPWLRRLTRDVVGGTLPTPAEVAQMAEVARG